MNTCRFLRGIKFARFTRNYTRVQLNKQIDNFRKKQIEYPSVQIAFTNVKMCAEK